MDVLVGRVAVISPPLPGLFKLFALLIVAPVVEGATELVVVMFKSFADPEVPLESALDDDLRVGVASFEESGVSGAASGEARAASAGGGVSREEEEVNFAVPFAATAAVFGPSKLFLTSLMAEAGEEEEEDDDVTSNDVGLPFLSFSCSAFATNFSLSSAASAAEMKESTLLLLSSLRSIIVIEASSASDEALPATDSTPSIGSSTPGEEDDEEEKGMIPLPSSSPSLDFFIFFAAEAFKNSA